MAKVFVNGSQNLTKEQVDILTERFGKKWEIISVPRGMNQAETKELVSATKSKNHTAVFFLDTNASLLLAELAYWNGFDYGNSFFGQKSRGAVYFFIEENGKWQLRDLTELV